MPGRMQPLATLAVKVIRPHKWKQLALNKGNFADTEQNEFPIQYGIGFQHVFAGALCVGLDAKREFVSVRLTRKAVWWLVTLTATRHWSRTACCAKLAGSSRTSSACVRHSCHHRVCEF